MFILVQSLLACKLFMLCQHMDYNGWLGLIYPIICDILAKLSQRHLLNPYFAGFIRSFGKHLDTRRPRY